MSRPDPPAACTACGLPLPDGGVAVGCPRCRLQLAFADETESSESVVARPHYFGDFELIEKLAEGGMGVVWKARQLSVPRLVALKMIHAGHLASAEARVRFAAEIEATARLDHPHIVPLYESGEHDGVHFFTMKLLAGGDLARRREAYGLPPAGQESGMPTTRERRDRQARIARLMVKLARAVHYAHLRGILHRDLKPSNVLLDESGEPCIGDFGLAKMLTRESGFTFTQSVLGSPNYMAPEQAAGKTSELTTATDVYGLGAIFHELLTGRPLFEAESPIATLRRVMSEPAPPPRKSDPSIDAELETVCLKCLEKPPASRYASAGALADDLERWLEGRPIQARRMSTLEHVWHWCRREPALAAMLAACGGLLVLVALSSTLAAVRIGRAQRAATAALRESLVNQARSLRLASDIGHRDECLRLLRAAIHPGMDGDLRRRARDEVLAALVRTDLEFVPWSAVRPARDPARNLMGPRFDRLASVLDDQTILIQGIPDGRESRRLRLDGSTAVRLEQFSHDGRFLGVRESDGIAIWDVEAGRVLWRTNGIDRRFCLATDRPEVVFEDGEFTATFLRLPELEAVRTVRGTPSGSMGGGRGWSAMALSPESRVLAVARSRDRVLEWIDVERDDVVRRITNRSAVVTMAWSPDGSRLATALANGRVPVHGWRGASSFDLRTLTRTARGLAFSPDGSLLAVVTEDRQVRLIETESMRNTFDAQADGNGIHFDPAGTRLGPVFRGDEIGMFEMRQPAEFRQITVGNTRTDFDGCTHSPDGRLVVVGNATNVIFCDAAGTGRLLSRGGWRVGALAFDPTTNLLYAANITGLYRWRLTETPGGRMDLQRDGQVWPGRGWRSFAFAADGSRFLAANIHSNAAYLYDRTLTQPMATLGPHPAPDSVAISPDARWAATGSSTDRQVRLWNVASGEPLKVLATGAEPRAVFSPDGRWFAAWGEAFSLLRVGTWEPAPPLPLGEHRPLAGAAAFSPDGRILAVVCNRHSIQLIDLENFRSLGLLKTPGPIALETIQFSPDGTRLAGSGALARLQLWDLRRIRLRLQDLGLDDGW